MHILSTYRSNNLDESYKSINFAEKKCFMRQILANSSRSKSISPQKNAESKSGKIIP